MLTNLWLLELKTCSLFLLFSLISAVILKDVLGCKILRCPNITCKVIRVGHDLSLIIEHRGLYCRKIATVDLTLKKRTVGRIPGVFPASLSSECKGKWRKDIHIARILVSVCKDVGF